MKPCLVECAGILLGEGAKSTVKQVSLSNVTVTSRIADMSCDVKSEFHRYFAAKQQHFIVTFAVLNTTHLWWY